MPTGSRALKGTITLVALVAILARVVWPDLRLDTVTLGLLALAALPWLSPLIKSAELPGGFKIEFQDVKQAGDKITAGAPLVGNPQAPAATSLESINIVANDPNLALVGLRIEIEKRLRRLAATRDLSPDQPLSRLVQALFSQRFLDAEEYEGLRVLIDAGNRAAHGASVSQDIMVWTKDYSGQILAALDSKLRNQL